MHQSTPGRARRFYPFAAYLNDPDQNLRREIEAKFGADPKLVLLKVRSLGTAPAARSFESGIRLARPCSLRAELLHQDRRANSPEKRL